jgi:hypothetical protein
MAPNLPPFVLPSLGKAERVKPDSGDEQQAMFR